VAASNKELRAMRHRTTGFVLAAATLALGACAGTEIRSRQTLLDETLHSYAATVRWGDIEQVQAFMEPVQRAANPPSAIELARFRQVQVTGYEAQPAVPVSESEVRQVARIDLVNVNTQSLRSVVDHQVWKFDEQSKRWWLVSGLPDISRQP
jgi:hypothetical protein